MLDPQDIAMVLHPLLEGAPKEKLEAVAQMLSERLNESIGAADVANALDFVDAFQNASIPPELVGSMALVQKVSCLVEQHTLCWPKNVKG